MHGVLFLACRRHAQQAYGLDVGGSFAADANYPDDAFAELVSEIAREASLDRDQVLRELGHFAGAVAFAELFPEYYAASPGTRAFLLAVEERIHEVVRATIAGAAPPRLMVLPLGDRGVVVSYTSERGLCALLEGVIAGTAAFYGESFALSQPACMERGDAACSVIVEPVR